MKDWLQVVFGAILTGMAGCLKFMSKKLKKKIN